MLEQPYTAVKACQLLGISWAYTHCTSRFWEDCIIYNILFSAVAKGVISKAVMWPQISAEDENLTYYFYVWKWVEFHTKMGNLYVLKKLNFFKTSILSLRLFYWSNRNNVLKANFKYSLIFNHSQFLEGGKVMSIFKDPHSIVIYCLCADLVFPVLIVLLS